MRVYLPASTTILRRLVDSGFVSPAPLTGFAVTPGLREWYLDDDEEALEYAAMSEAARACLRLIDADPDAAPRRVVLAVEVAASGVTARDDVDRGVVRVHEPVPLAAIAAVHLDESDAGATVREAARAIDAADLGDDQAQQFVDDAQGFELSWYANQEIGAILGRF